MAEEAANKKEMRKWKTVSQSIFLNGIPYTNQYLKLMKHDTDCDCDAYCDCQWNPPDPPSCGCIIDNKECKNCDGCASALTKGHADNQQISRLGITPKKTSVTWLNEQMGHSLVMEEDWKAGDALIGFAGHVILDADVPEEHQVYVIDLGSWEFELQQDYKEYKKGRIFKGKWSMDCTNIGTDANFINSTCGNNNAKTYTQIVGGLPTPIAFAAKAGKSGL